MAQADASIAALDVRRSISQVGGVIRRNWLILVILELAVTLPPVIVFWVGHGFAPSHLDRLPPLARIPQWAASWALGTLFSYAAARITLADEVRGQKLGLRGALSMSPLTAVSLAVAAFVGSLPSALFDIFFTLGALSRTLYIGASLFMILVGAVTDGFVGVAIPVVAGENLGGFAALARSIRLGAGNRAAVINSFALIGGAFFLAKETVAIVIGDAVWSGTHDVALETTWRSVWWNTFGLGADIFWAVWVPMLYLELRRAREGLAYAQEASVFD